MHNMHSIRFCFIFSPRRQYEKVRIGILLIFSLAHLLLQEVASLYELEQTRQGIYKKIKHCVQHMQLLIRWWAFSVTILGEAYCSNDLVAAG